MPRGRRVVVEVVRLLRLVVTEKNGKVRVVRSVVVCFGFA